MILHSSENTHRGCRHMLEDQYIQTKSLIDNGGRWKNAQLTSAFHSHISWSNDNIVNTTGNMELFGRIFESKCQLIVPQHPIPTPPPSSQCCQNRMQLYKSRYIFQESTLSKPPSRDSNLDLWFKIFLLAFCLFHPYKLRWIAPEWSISQDKVKVCATAQTVVCFAANFAIGHLIGY